MQRGWVVSPDYRAVINALKDARMQAGISQRELARRLGKPPSFVNKIEQLERRLDVLEFIAIADAMEVQAAELLYQMRQVLPDTIALVLTDQCQLSHCVAQKPTVPSLSMTNIHAVVTELQIHRCHYTPRA